MSTRIRLRRMGSNKRPFFRVVVADQRSPRDGRFIENIGLYHPLDDPSVIEIDQERALHWLRVGAQPSNQVRNLMVKVGIWETFVKERPSAAADAPSREREQKERISKKAKERVGTEAESPPEPAAEAEPVAPEPEVADAAAAEAIESVEAAAESPEAVEEAAGSAETQPADAPEAATDAETDEAE
jgi:small subunit ribosomal protein S16